jgi:hypothetical protein
MPQLVKHQAMQNKTSAKLFLAVLVIAAAIAILVAVAVTNIHGNVPPRAMPIGMPSQWTPAKQEGVMPQTPEVQKPN